jgi:hypothetical protein
MRQEEPRQQRKPSMIVSGEVRVRCWVAARALGGVLCLVLATTKVAAQGPPPIRFEQDYSATLRKAQNTGVPILAVFLAPGRTAPQLYDRGVAGAARGFLCIRLPIDGKLAGKLELTGAASVAILDADEKPLAKLGPDFTARQLVETLNEVAAAVRADFLATLKDAQASAADLKRAMEGLMQMKARPSELVPLLIHRDSSVAGTAARALGAAPYRGAAAVALLDGMASDNAALRAACHPLAIKATGYKNCPPLSFWQEASETDRKEAVEKWRAATVGAIPLVNRGVIEFALAHEGQQVGNGECSTLAVEALAAANGQPIRYSGRTYVWGKAVENGDPVLPGDIVQLEDARFRNGAFASHHTQVIKRILGPNRYEIMEQNFNGRRTVGPGILDLNSLFQGTAVIYRPQPRRPAP